ncbi:MAG: prephenate dehydratase [bacterium]|nr:prephenate dehydratase [bacterium]
MTPTIGIIGGKGRMGKLFANFFKERGVKVLISDRKTKLKNRDLAEKSDITIVSVPIDKTERVIQEVLPYIKGAIMDLTSLKVAAVKAMLKGKCEVLGIHPMFGDTNPIPGQTIILCPTKKSGTMSKWMETFLTENKVKIHKMTPKQHDKIMTTAQGLIHFADITFADALRRNNIPIKQLLEYTGKASELKVQLAARLIAQDPGLYGNIQIQNPQSIKTLKLYKKSVDDLIEIVEKKDIKSFKKYFIQNKKFLGNYTKEAYKDSSYLIDKLMALHKKTPKKYQEKPGKGHIAVLGPANTFSDLAATRYLQGRHLEKYYTKDIDEVFELVSSGTVSEGIVPIENKLHGTVREALDGLFSNDVHIAQTINIEIHHCLICLRNAKKSDIKRIRSHSQALHQCSKYLDKYYPKAAKQAFPSTVYAIDRVLTTNDKTTAVIAPYIAADDPNLRIIDKNIEDEEGNSTTFIVIRRGKTKNSGPKTSIAFHFSADAPGSLFSVFQDFKNARINMTKIESRPTKSHFGDYIFYLDFEGELNDPKVKKLLKGVEKKVAKLKILGSY